MPEAQLHTTKAQHPKRWAPFSLAMFAFVSYLLIAVMRTYRGMNLLETDSNHPYLRNYDHPREFFNTPLDFDKSIALHGMDLMDWARDADWDERLFSPLLFFPEIRQFQQEISIDPAFKISKDGGVVKLKTSIPDVPLENIAVEVVNDRFIHIRGTKSTGSSHVSFEKRFSIGQKVDEAKLQAKMTKSGLLEISAPEVTDTEVEEVVRKIPVSLAEEL